MPAGSEYQRSHGQVVCHTFVCKAHTCLLIDFNKFGSGELEKRVYKLFFGYCSAKFEVF